VTLRPPLSVPRFKGALALAILAAAALSLAAEGASSPSPASLPGAQAASMAGDPKSPDLQEARARLASASTPAEYARMLDSSSASLPPQDALALLDQGLPGAAPEYRRSLTLRAADLDLLLGLFGDAASRYEAASILPPGGKDPAMALRAARCFLAAGEVERAQSASAAVLMAASGDADLSASARLVGAWALIMQDRPEDGAAIAAAIADSAPGGQGSPRAEWRREARFILWLCAGEKGKKQAASTLASEFPGSPEALIAAGSASAPPLPHWYLGALAPDRLRGPSSKGVPSGDSPQRLPPTSESPSRAAAGSPGSAAPSEVEASPTGPDSSGPPPQAAPPTPAASKGKRLQVGYFSREDNAQALKDELSAKGFAPSIEVRFRSASASSSQEKRWIVVVDPGKDISTTLQKLKDAGYESYVIE